MSGPEIFGLLGPAGRSSAPADRGPRTEGGGREYGWVLLAGTLVASLNLVAALVLIPASAFWTVGIPALDLLVMVAVILGHRQSRKADTAAGSGRRPHRNPKRPAAPSEMLAVPGSDSMESTASEERPPQWLAWRGAAQKMRRAWNEWSAAGPRDRERLYRRYEAAAAEEERAAGELELTVRRVAEAQSPSGPSDRQVTSGAPR
jgi:hypothetical protein